MRLTGNVRLGFALLDVGESPLVVSLNEIRGVSGAILEGERMKERNDKPTFATSSKQRILIQRRERGQPLALEIRTRLKGRSLTYPQQGTYSS